MRSSGRILRLAVLVCLALGCASASAFAAPALPVTSAPAVCSATISGELPCTWTDGVNLYPGDSDAFSRKGTLSRVTALTRPNGFNAVVIDVPISAANYTDAHVQMPIAGQHETYSCASHSAAYYSPSSKQVVAIGRRVLAADARSLIVIKPILALGGSCDPARYDPAGKYFGSGYTKGASNEAAFAHFYTAILLRLADDAEAINTAGHVVLDDATEMDCLFADPSGAGYVGYFNSLPGQIAKRHPNLAQMFSLDSDFTDTPGSSCGYPGTSKGRPAVNLVKKDATFLSEVGIVGIQENFALPGGDPSVASVVSRWGTVKRAVAGSAALTADGMVRYLHTATGADVVLSSIGYNDCSANPAVDPTSVPAFCNKIYGKQQGVPSLSEVTGDQNADTAAYCYWTQAEGTTDPWFIGMWWWNRDFDAAPYVNPYDLTWGSSNHGTSPLASLRDFQLGKLANGCPSLA